MTDFLGKFIKEYPVGDDSEFLVRGLTVAEYIELSQRDFFTKAEIKPSLFIQMTEACVVGWRGFVDEDNQELEYHPKHLGHFSDDELIQVGKFIIEEQTLVSEELEHKVRGYVRFTNHISKDENDVLRESFDCNNCIMKGYWESRATVCSRFTREQVDIIRGNSSSKEEVEEKVKMVNKAKDKLRAKRRGRGRKGTAAKNKSKSAILTMANFKFPQCPVSWIDNWIFVAGGILHHSQSGDIPFFSGGLADQPYKLYRISRIIASESNQIDKEEFEERNK